MSKKHIEYLIHMAIWAVMFIWPLMFMNHGKGVNLVQYTCMSIVQIALMAVFYTNYLWLTPRYFERGPKKVFWIANLLLILGFTVSLHYWIETARSAFGTEPSDRQSLPITLHIMFMMRDAFNFTIAAAIATALRLALKWQDSENARRQAEADRTKAELRNLRSQINPHFLLNTLNNIYALTAFNTEKAQTAIQELSKLLRFILYENDETYVDINKEIQFLDNYINLMRIRVSDNVDVQFTTRLPSPCNAKIAPLIFISLIENAFKHGVSPIEPSFIHITIAVGDGKTTCSIVNSNHPKDASDKSGHGIGLKQVASRLELTYKDRYEWEYGLNQDKTIYSSKITIHDTKLCNH